MGFLSLVKWADHAPHIGHTKVPGSVSVKICQQHPTVLGIKPKLCNTACGMSQFPPSSSSSVMSSGTFGHALYLLASPFPGQIPFKLWDSFITSYLWALLSPPLTGTLTGFQIMSKLRWQLGSIGSHPCWVTLANPPNTLGLQFPQL